MSPATLPEPEWVAQTEWVKHVIFNDGPPDPSAPEIDVTRLEATDILENHLTAKTLKLAKKMWSYGDEESEGYRRMRGKIEKISPLLEIIWGWKELDARLQIAIERDLRKTLGKRPRWLRVQLGLSSWWDYGIGRVLPPGTGPPAREIDMSDLESGPWPV